MKLFKRFLAVLVVFFAIFVAYRVYKPASSVSLETVQVVRQSIRAGVKVPGNVVPLTRIQVFPPVTGRIESIFVQEGDTVKEGQLLAEISSVERATILDVAKSEGPDKVAYWENVYKPIKIYAPISGQVIVLNTTVAQIVSNTMPLLTLSDRLMVKAQVDETDMAKVRPGMKVFIRLDTYPDEEILGEVKQLSYESTVINNVSVYTVEINLFTPPKFLRSGMTVSAWIAIKSKKNVLVVPEKAIQYQANLAYVFLKTKKGFQKQPVQIGIQNDGFVEILSGVSEHDVLQIVSPMKSNSSSPGYSPFRRQSKKND